MHLLIVKETNQIWIAPRNELFTKRRLPITTTNTKIQLTDVTSPLFIILRDVELELLIDSLFLTILN